MRPSTSAGDLPKPIVGGRIIRHCSHHGLPVGRNEPCRFTITVGAQTAIAPDALKWLDNDARLEEPIHESQECKLRDLGGRHMIKPVQLGVVVNGPPNLSAQSVRRQSCVDRVLVPLNGLATVPYETSYSRN